MASVRQGDQPAGKTRNAFEYLRYGYAAATAVMLLLTLAAVALQWRLVRRLRWLGRT